MSLQPPPQQQQQQQAGLGEAQIPAMTTPEAVPTPGAWQPSGSIGPFFSVISVITALSLLSCYLGHLGRKWIPRPRTPLESIENESRSCFDWLKLFRRPCIPTPVQVKNVNKSPEILASADDKHSDDDYKVEEGEVIAAQNQHPQV